MIHPSYVDLMEVVNKNVEEGETPVINSRYSIVMATAKRARQIVDGDEPLVKVSRGEKPLSIAVDELNQAEIRILAEDEEEEEYMELTGSAEETEDAAAEAEMEASSEEADGSADNDADASLDTVDSIEAMEGTEEPQDAETAENAVEESAEEAE